MKPCPFCGEIPSHPQPMAIHPNNDCILNGVMGTWDQWQDRPGERAARVKALKEMRQELCLVTALELSENWRIIQNTFDGIFDKLIEAEGD